MSAAALLLSASLLGLAQPLPAELNSNQERRGFDPVLPATIAPAVARAVEAELDAKRGTQNAVEILKAEQRRISGDRDLELSLNVRLAAAVLRARFSSNDKVEKAVGLQQALSTYAKLDVSDPGLAAWIERAVEATPAAKEAFAKTGRKIEVALFARGEGLDVDAFSKRLSSLVSASGFTLVKKPPKQTVFLLKLSADQVREAGKAPAVRVTLEISKELPAPLKRSLFRTVEAKDADVAMAAAVEWLARIGGRDLIFHWMAEHGLPEALPMTPRSSGHGGHGH
jgi:hypothetical protein